MTPEQDYYYSKVQPMLRQPWVRSSSRRVLKRLGMFALRHVHHLRIYAQLQALAPEASFKTMARDLVILPFMVGKKILIHDGRRYPMVIPTAKEVGLRLGELAYPKMLLHKHTSKTKVKTIKK